MSENITPTPHNDIEAHFDAILAGHGETSEVDFAVAPLEGHENETYSVLRSDGSIENGWTPYEAGNNVVRLKKEALSEDGRPVTLTKLVDVDAFTETQRFAERLTERAHVGAEMAKRALMVQEVLDRKRRDTYPYNHRDDLDYIDTTDIQK